MPISSVGTCLVDLSGRCFSIHFRNKKQRKKKQLARRRKRHPVIREEVSAGRRNKERGKCPLQVRMIQTTVAFPRPTTQMKTTTGNPRRKQEEDMHAQKHALNLDQNPVRCFMLEYSSIFSL